MRLLKSINLVACTGFMVTPRLLATLALCLSVLASPGYSILSGFVIDDKGTTDSNDDRIYCLMDIGAFVGKTHGEQIATIGVLDFLGVSWGMASYDYMYDLTSRYSWVTYEGVFTFTSPSPISTSARESSGGESAGVAESEASLLGNVAANARLPATVPDTGTTLTLLGLALTGLVALRRRFG